MFRCDKVIRFRRKGHKHLAIYDIVAICRSKRNRSSYYERLGFLSLNRKDQVFFIDLNMLGFYINKGFYVNSSLKKRLSKLII